MDPLFPEIAEDLSELDDGKLSDLISEHRDAAARIKEEDEFTAGLSAEEIVAEYDRGLEQVKALVAERKSRTEAAENFDKALSERDDAFAALLDEPKADEDPGDEDSAPVEVVAEETVPEVEEVEAEVVEEPVLVTADAAVEEPAPVVRLRKTPVPSADRIAPVTEEPGTPLLPVGPLARSTEPFGAKTLAAAMQEAMQSVRHIPKSPHGGGYRTGGTAVPVAKADFSFPEERTLGTDAATNAEKLAEVIVASLPGGIGQYSLTASGGLCAPATPFYSMVNFASEAEPVWDALPKFRASRGSVSIPESTYIGDITTAISSISEEEDAAGGTFATKSCQALECVEYTTTAVQILAHCREYGNLNAISWPEKIAHENAITMAALARTSETFMLDRLKALSVNVTNGAETLGALIYLVDAIVKAKFGIIGRFRMPAASRFAAYIPNWVPDMLALDTIQTIDGNRFRSKGELVGYLGALGIDPVFYMDSPSTDTTQLPDATQTAAAIDSLPDNVQWALHPQGAFIGLDMGSLELGVVRDSTLNSTNDFQIFGERFRNLARVAPAQTAYWVTSDLCAIGQFPPAGSARTCD